MASQKVETTRKILEDIRNMLRWFLSGEGAIVTLTLLVIAGIVGYLIQDAIQRQRYLELLELELRGNYNNANIEIKMVNNHQYLYSHIPIHTEVYYAGLQQGYLITLDPQTQGQLYALYTGYFVNMNTLNSHYMDVINESEAKWEQCIINSPSPQPTSSNSCSLEHQQYLSVQQIYSNFIASNDVQIWKHIQAVKFNPTEERLHPKSLEGFILRLFMGNQSLKIQQ